MIQEQITSKAKRLAHWSLDDIIRDVERHKGWFDPSREMYKEFLFRYGCRILELYRCDVSRLITPLVHRQAIRTLMATQAHYDMTDKLYHIYIPPSSMWDDMLTHDIKDGFYRKEIDALIKENP